MEPKLPSQGVFFFNPAAGVKFTELTALVAAASDAGLEPIELAPGGDVTADIRARIARGTKSIVVAGGDGSVNSVLQALVHTDATLAVIPIGTYNHFARDLGIPSDWRAALDIALNGATQQIDTARVNERFFVNNVSMGLYPGFVARREAHGRDYPRWKARLYAALMTLHKYPHVALTIESEHHQQMIRTHVFMVSNNSYDLTRIGIEAPRTNLTEGRLSVYWLPHGPRTQLMKFAARFLAGRMRGTPGFRSFRTQRMKVQSSRKTLDVSIDGEVFTIAPPLVITIVPQSLLVRVGR